MVSKHITITLIIALAAGAIGFFAGSTIAAGKNNSAPSFMARNGINGNAVRGNRQGQGPGGGGFINGTILSKDSQSITIKLTDGGSKILFLSDTTAIDRLAPAAAADLAIGTSVMASGKTNDDGSITARMVQIRPVEMPLPESLKKDAAQK